MILASWICNVLIHTGWKMLCFYSHTPSPIRTLIAFRESQLICCLWQLFSCGSSRWPRSHNGRDGNKLPSAGDARWLQNRVQLPNAFLSFPGECLLSSHLGAQTGTFRSSSILAVFATDKIVMEDLIFFKRNSYCRGWVMTVAHPLAVPVLKCGIFPLSCTWLSFGAYKLWLHECTW